VIVNDWNGPTTYRPIGVIHTPHIEPAKTPIQPRYAEGIEGRIDIDPAFEQGLDDLDGFSHIVLLYHFHRAKPYRLKLVPFIDDVPRGVFSTRAPSRPNSIGLSVVRLVRRDGCVLHVVDVDMLDETPLLDIKPHIERFGTTGPIRSGWQDSIREDKATRRGRRLTS